MRLFIALPLPDPVRAALAAAQERLRRGNPPVRWIDATRMHLTLQFLGETSAAVVPTLVAGLAELAVPPIHLALSGLGAFPGLQRPRVIWAGIAGDIGALDRLRAAVFAVTTPLGFAPDTRPFTPHLTLGRLRDEARPEQIRTLAATLRAADTLPPLAWEADRPILYQSTLKPEGAVYTALGPEPAA
ncbi:MAG: RNA 2',3'-cyclic phosphodiesterase [Chloroflexaceae bacterium]